MLCPQKTVAALSFGVVLISQAAYTDSISAGLLSKTGSHCATDEVVYFNCITTESLKVASLCGKGFNAKQGKSGYLQYRFGEIGKVELIFPEHINADVAKDKFFYVSDGNIEGFQQKLSFITDEYVYQLNHATGDGDQSGESKPYEISSIYIGKNGTSKQKIVLICSNEKAGEGLLALFSVVPLMSSPDPAWRKSFF